jgi:hypothetical protein
MMRASLYISNSLHQRLVLASKRKKTNISDLARQLLDKALALEEHYNTQQMYKELGKLDGFIKDPITNASTTIDEVLYGENGAWKGSDV